MRNPCVSHGDRFNDQAASDRGGERGLRFSVAWRRTFDAASTKAASDRGGERAERAESAGLAASTRPPLIEAENRDRAPERDGFNEVASDRGGEPLGAAGFNEAASLIEAENAVSLSRLLQRAASDRGGEHPQRSRTQTKERRASTRPPLIEAENLRGFVRNAR